MKRTSLALLLSLMVHLGIIVAFLGWEDEASSLKHERISLHMSTRVVSSKETMSSIEQPQNESSTASVVRASNEAKPLPHKKEKRTSKTTETPLMSDAKIAQENNETSFLETSPLPTDTRLSSNPESNKQTYLELHGNEIRALIEKNKEYPELARKRSLSDTVHVSFTLTSHGEIEDVAATSHSTILSKSATETLHRAKAFFPKPTENVTIKIPIIYVIK